MMFSGTQVTWDSEGALVSFGRLGTETEVSYRVSAEDIVKEARILGEFYPDDLLWHILVLIHPMWERRTGVDKVYLIETNRDRKKRTPAELLAIYVALCELS